jgi:tetratricopeptide (TPR) repeat protein
MHVKVGRSLFHISRCLNKLGRNDEVLELHQQIEQIFQNTCGLKHPFYAWSVEVKARALLDQGKYKAALPLYQHSLSLLITLLGDQDIAYSWDGIGWCYFYLRDYKQAKQAFLNGLPRDHENSSQFFRTYKGLGWCYIKEGKGEIGLSYLLKQLKAAAKIFQNTKKMTWYLQNFQKALNEVKEKKVNVENFIKEAEQINEESSLFFKDENYLPHVKVLPSKPKGV